MSKNDSFIYEVNEELRQERNRAFWRRYGWYFVGFAIFLVVATIVYQIYGHLQSNKAEIAGDNYLSALNLAQSQNFDQALSKLKEVEQTNIGSYPTLAAFRIAGVKQEQGNMQEALVDFDRIATDGRAPEILQKMAKLRAGALLVDMGALQDVEHRVIGMATAADPLRIQARELLGLAQWKAGNIDEAVSYFQQNQNEAADVSAVERAQIMLALVRGGYKASAE